jgi:hypothetical protein
MGRFRTLLTGTLAAALIACGGSSDEDSSAAGGPRSDPASAPTPLAPLEWAPSRDHVADSLFGPRADSADLGIGLVALRMPAFPASLGHRDTLHFRAAPRPDAAPVAALVLEGVDSTSWRYALLGPPGTRINVKEYAYEESGVPVDSIEGRWVRGIVGWEPSGARVTGWANADDTARVDLVRWSEHLKTRVWYFLAPDSARVYASLADTASSGAPLPLTDPERLDIEPIETRGRWMRMRVLYPYNRCEDQGKDTTAATRREVWVEYLDRRGRPKVFYPSRGC